jgi:hypothetical protein
VPGKKAVASAVPLERGGGRMSGATVELHGHAWLVQMQSHWIQRPLITRVDVQPRER